MIWNGCHLDILSRFGLPGPSLCVLWELIQLGAADPEVPETGKTHISRLRISRGEDGRP